MHLMAPSFSNFFIIVFTSPLEQRACLAATAFVHANVSFFTNRLLILPHIKYIFLSSVSIIDASTLSSLELKIQVTDMTGLTSSKVVVLKADTLTADSSISFDRLNPLDKRVRNNKDALALIVGVSSYENTKAKALSADSGLDLNWLTVI